MGTPDNIGEILSSTENSDFKDGIKAYIADEILHVVIEEINPSYGQLSFYDLSGRLQFTKNVAEGMNRINIESMTDGFYIAQITEGQSLLYATKLVK